MQYAGIGTYEQNRYIRGYNGKKYVQSESYS